MYTKRPLVRLITSAQVPLLIALALAIHAPPADAQRHSRFDPGRAQLTRAELQQMLGEVEAESQSADLSEHAQTLNAREARLIRIRLEEGDLQTGDRVDLVVEGEPQLTGEFSVSPGRVLRLPQVGDIALQGVLRSELESHLSRELSKFFRNPVVRARSYIRVTILGEVGSPGYYSVPTDALLTEALMEAGGPTRHARLTGIRIERGDDRIWQGDEMQEAIVDGRTLDHLSMRAGDRIVLPRQRRFSAGMLRDAVWVLSSVVLLANLIF